MKGGSSGGSGGVSVPGKRGAEMSVALMKVIAVESFTDADGVFHPYGHEFEMEDTLERAALLKAGTLREDDRMNPSRATKPKST